jgi:hypothetical protein
MTAGKPAARSDAMTAAQAFRHLYRVTITIHGCEHPSREGSDLAAALSDAGLAAAALDVRSESEAHSIVVVFDGLAADELPSRQQAQDPAEAQALALVGSLRDEPAALLPAMRALLALSAARERGQLPAHQRMTLEIEPWYPA